MTTATRKPKKVAAKKKAQLKLAALQSVGVRELRQNASKVLDQVKDGAIIEITEHGVPVARISPITKSLYEEYIESGLIKPARNPNWQPTKNPVKITGNKTSTEVLMEMRAEGRY